MRKLVVALALVLLMVTGVFAGPEKLMGTWQGKYEYSVDTTKKSANFELIIEDVNGSEFSGYTLETNMGAGPKRLKTLRATIKGRYDEMEDSIKFKKTYDFPGGHSINYQGWFSGDSEILGEWDIGKDWFGSFEMSK